MSEAPEDDSEAITSILQVASEGIRGELLTELAKILVDETDHKRVVAKLGEAYERLVAPLIRDLVLMEMRFNYRLDQVGARLMEMDQEDGRSTG